VVHGWWTYDQPPPVPHDQCIHHSPTTHTNLLATMTAPTITAHQGPNHTQSTPEQPNFQFLVGLTPHRELIRVPSGASSQVTLVPRTEVAEHVAIFSHPGLRNSAVPRANRSLSGAGQAQEIERQRLTQHLRLTPGRHDCVETLLYIHDVVLHRTCCMREAHPNRSILYCTVKIVQTTSGACACACIFGRGGEGKEGGEGAWYNAVLYHLDLLRFTRTLLHHCTRPSTYCT
jgi:hypothetical protein